MKNTKKSLPFYALNFFIFSIFAVFSNYLVAYLGSIGLTASEIGVVTTFGCVLVVSLQVFLGTVADKSKNKVMIFRIELSVMLVFTILASFSRGFVPLLMTVSVVSFLTTIVVTMCEAITVGESKKIGSNYGHLRLAGAVGYMVCSLLAGRFAENNVSSIFIMLILLLVTILVITFFLPNIPGEYKKGDKASILKVINQKEIILVLTLVFVLGTCSNFFVNYAVIYYESIGIGLSTMGVLFFFGAAFEIPFLFFLDRLVKKFGARNLILAAAFFSLIRWTVMAIIQHPAIGIFSQLMHGYTFSLGTVSAIRYMSEKVPAKFSATGQMVASLAMNGFSRIVAFFFGGYVIDYFGGVTPIFKYLAIIMLVAIVLFIIFCPKESREQVE